MIIDFHTHCFQGRIEENAVSTLEKCAGIKAVNGAKVDDLRSYMHRCGVDKSVVLPVATKPSQIYTINQWAMKHRDDELCFFGAVHPDDEDFSGTVSQLQKDGFKGVKFHPDYQHFYADEKRLMPCYEALRDANMIVVLHAGVDIGYPSPVYCTPLMIRHIMENIPGLCIVAAHMGSHALWRDVEELLLGRSLYIDTAYSHYILGKTGMERMIKKHGAEHVLLGSDYPWKSIGDEIKNISSLSLPASDIEKILFRNALSLLR